MTMPRVLTVSAITALAASSLVFLGQYALAEAVSNTPSNAQPRAAVPASQVIVRSASLSPRSANAARVPAVKVKTHVLLVSRALLDEAKISYDLKVPMHHVRPDTAETLADAALIDEAAAGRLLKIAHSGPGNMDFCPEPEVYPEDEDEFDCLSDMFRGSEPLPPELLSSVVNGLSLAYNLKSSSDGRQVVFSPVTIMRADYPAAEIPNTAAHEAPYDHHVSIFVASGGTLLIDAGPVKASRTESQPSRHLVVLVQPELIKPEQKSLAKAN